MKKNILFLMSDEHRFDVTGYAGNEIIRTPNLDRLAAQAYNFTNAYTASPICVPGRMALMAGQLPSTCDCRGWRDLTPNYYTFARHFAVNGYNTVACGKLHHTGNDPMQGFTRRIGSEIAIERSPHTGLESNAYLADVKWSDAKEIQRAGIGKGPYVVEDEYAKLGALNFIDSYFCNPYYDRNQNDVPLMLKVSFNQPHYPYTAESEERFCYYLNRVKPYYNQSLSEHPFLKMRAITVGKDVSAREEIRALAAYYAMVETVDEYIGDIIKRLENVGQDINDWVIVYTSDHGDMLGEHGVWEKQKFYEGSVKVPFLVYIPGKPGGVIDRNVSHVDLYATLCEICGLDIPSGLDSRSLMGLIDGDENWDNCVVSQFYGNGFDNCMIKRDNLKYQYYRHSEGDSEVLFDLERDPLENTNFIHDKRYDEVIRRFREQIKL